MKLLKYKTYLLLSTLFLGLLLSSCSEDTVVVPKTLEQYKSETTTYVNNEITKVNACVIGYALGNFKTSSTVAPNFDTYKANYLTVLNKSLTTLNSADVTIAKIIAAQGELTASGKLFNASLWTSDRTALNDQVVAASALNSATVVGTTTGTTTQAAKDELTAAITAAKSVRDSSAYIQRNVDEATASLIAAITAFQSSIIK